MKNQHKQNELQARLDREIAEFLCNAKSNAINPKNPYLAHQDSTKKFPQVVVTLTSYPARIPTLHYTLFTLFTQDFKPHKVILWLSQDEFVGLLADLPKEVLDFRQCGLEIVWVKGNIKSYKKLIYAIKEFGDCVLVSADDDALYAKDWLFKLYDAYKQNSHCIHAHRAHRIVFDKYGKILPYLKWNLDISHKQSVPSFLNLPTGVGGILYPPPRCLHNDVLKEEIFMELCPYGDDLWFWAMAVLNGTKINVVKDNLKMQSSFVDTTKSGALWIENAKWRNDWQIQNLLKFYPILKQRVIFDSNEYWEIRYKSHEDSQGLGASGAGSYGDLAVFKAKVINDFVKKHKIQSVIEWGCGDGNQLFLAQYPQYTGLDVSPCVIESVKRRFANDKSKVFYEVGGFLENPSSAELGLSLDVIYHLVDDEKFESYMRNLFAYAQKFVIIYSSNKELHHTQHVRHRQFSSWVQKYAVEWKFKTMIPNAYPYDENKLNESSFCDFYVYEKQK